ncbi:MAG: bifunctional oligoribonuclease/PAP phosphatase NrnA [Clostridia bacterium]|nr:bifunctional oligoribonuclease/PAP phosphatase NrnA [Clostridia bacterium]
MHNFPSLTLDELIARLEVPQSTLILFHRNPDADAVGSAFALKTILEELGSEAFCVCQNEIPARLRFLTNDEQESVLPEAIPEEMEIERIISVDSASPSQLGELWELYGDQIDLMIDHHASGEPYAENLIDPTAAATGEILFDLAKKLIADGRITATYELYTDLYAAISSDTGCFRYSNVTPKTHVRAAELLASGIDCADINHRLFESKSLEQLRAQAAGISNLHIFADGKIAVATFPYALKAALGLSDEHLEVLIDVARSLAGVKVAIAIRQPATEGVFRVSTRSNCNYDVSALCAKFDGGGHKKAAGCTVTASTMDEAVNKLVRAIDAEELN